MASDGDNSFPQGKHHNSIADTCNSLMNLGDLLCTNPIDKSSIDAFIAVVENYITREKIDALRVAREPCSQGHVHACLEDTDPLIIAHLSQDFYQKLQSLKLYQVREDELRRAISRCKESMLAGSGTDSCGSQSSTNGAIVRKKSNDDTFVSFNNSSEERSDASNDGSGRHSFGHQSWFCDTGSDQAWTPATDPSNQKFSEDENISRSGTPQGSEDNASPQDSLGQQSETFSTASCETEHTLQPAPRSAGAHQQHLEIWEPDCSVSVDVSMDVPNEDFSDPPVFSDYRERWNAIVQQRRQGFSQIPLFFRYGVRYFPKEYLDSGTNSTIEPSTPGSRVVMFYNLPKSLELAELLRFVCVGATEVILRAFISCNTGYVEFETTESAHRYIKFVNFMKRRRPGSMRLGCGPTKLSMMPTYPMGHDVSHARLQGFTRCLAVGVPDKKTALGVLDILDALLLPGVDDILEDAWLYDGGGVVHSHDLGLKKYTEPKVMVALDSVLNASRAFRILRKENFRVHVTWDPCSRLTSYIPHHMWEVDTDLARRGSPSLFEQWKEAKHKVETLSDSSEVSSVCSTTSKSHYDSSPESSTHTALIQLDSPASSPKCKSKEIQAPTERQSPSPSYRFTSMDDFNRKWGYESYVADKTSWQQNVDTLADSIKKTGWEDYWSNYRPTTCDTEPGKATEEAVENDNDEEVDQDMSYRTTGYTQKAQEMGEPWER